MALQLQLRIEAKKETTVNSLFNVISVTSSQIGFVAGKRSMAIIFLLYAFTFLALLQRKKRAAYVLFGASTLASVAMFWYHVDSVLNLNF